jgi:hypothetical protein
VALREEIAARLREMLETLASRHGDAAVGRMEADNAVAVGRKR